MWINKIQFQKGLSLLDFVQRYGTEQQCIDALAKVRWPNGYRCEACGHDNYAFIKSRKLYQCNRCKFQTTVIRNTIFHSTNLRLTQWFLAMYLISQNKNGVSALELKRYIGVSYPTAWRVKQKLTQVMMETENEKKLTGLIEVDDAYLGGALVGGKRGRGSENKLPFIAAVKTTLSGYPIFAKFTKVQTFSKKEVSNWANSHIEQGSYVITDCLPAFKALDDMKYTHIKVKVGSGKKAARHPSFKWVNTVLGNVKNSISGTYHHNSKKYSSKYLAEFQYRFNRRFNLNRLFTSIIYHSVNTPPLGCKLIKVAANC